MHLSQLITWSYFFHISFEVITDNKKGVLKWGNPPDLLGFWSSGELTEISMAVHFFRRDCGSLKPTLLMSRLLTFKF